MPEETGLIERAGTSMMLTPADVVKAATEQAKLLMGIVEQTKCFQDISGKRYLQVEAWETIGAFNRVHAVTKSILPIGEGSNVLGYMADVELLNSDGDIVGGAMMPCFFTENACRGKEGDAKHKACISAAQTFATSKAYRMNYSYVAILAGYQPTPAEEMSGEDSVGQTPSQKHWCSVHNIAFFKKGKMKGYAHKIEGTDEWCNEATNTPEKPTPKPENIEPEVPGEPEGKRNPETLTSWYELQSAIKADFDMSMKDAGFLLGVVNWEKETRTPAECYRLIAEAKG